MNQKILTILIVLLTCKLYSQGELVVTEMNSDNDAVIEIVGEDELASDYVKMTLGFNKSNHGWLRTKTDHDLSFWTNNLKRLTIKNDGYIGIGTSIPLQKLFIKDGSIGLDTKVTGLDGSNFSSLSFYDNNTYRGGMSYGYSPADGGHFMSINVNDDGNLNIKTDNQTRLNINGNGDVRINNLSGTDSRILYVESDGTLTTEAEERYIVVKPSNFSPDYDIDGVLEDRLSQLSGKIDFSLFPRLGGNMVRAFGRPQIPFTRYEVLDITIRFRDESDRVFEFYAAGSSYQSDLNSSALQTVTIPINQVYNQSMGQNISLQVVFRDNYPYQSFDYAIIRYKPL